MPKVSIILPVYNGEKTLKATIDSLVSQTFQDFELLIGIDGTKDASKQIASSFKDSRIKIIEHSKNLGLAANLNALIDVSDSSSSFIAMAEQDDIYVPERLQWQIELMEEQPEIGLISGIAAFMSEHNTVLFPGLLVNGKQFPQGVELFKYLYVYQLKVVNTCMLFRKSTHQKHQLTFRGTYGNFNVDWNYVLRFSLISKIYGIQKKLVEMNRFNNVPSVTSNKWEQFKASRQLLLDFKNECSSLVDTALYKQALKEHRKIELGHRTKLCIVVYSIYYFFYYLDPYFIKYLILRYYKYREKSILV